MTVKLKGKLPKGDATPTSELERMLQSADTEAGVVIVGRVRLVTMTTDCEDLDSPPIYTVRFTALEVASTGKMASAVDKMLEELYAKRTGKQRLELVND